MKRNCNKKEKLNKRNQEKRWGTEFRKSPNGREQQEEGNKKRGDEEVPRRSLAGASSVRIQASLSLGVATGCGDEECECFCCFPAACMLGLHRLNTHSIFMGLHGLGFLFISLGHTSTRAIPSDTRFIFALFYFVKFPIMLGTVPEPYRYRVLHRVLVRDPWQLPAHQRVNLMPETKWLASLHLTISLQFCTRYATNFDIWWSILMFVNE